MIFGGSSNGAGPATAQHVYLLLYRAGPTHKLHALTGSWLSGGSAFHDLCTFLLLSLRKPDASPPGAWAINLTRYVGCAEPQVSALLLAVAS